MKKTILFLVIFTTSLSVSVKELSIINTVVVFLAGLPGFIYLFAERIGKSFLKHVMGYLSPFVLSICISLPVNYMFNGSYDYASLNASGRIINLAVLPAVFLFTDYMLRTGKISVRFLLRAYLLSCGLIALSALWQALDIYAGFPLAFPLETRSLLHSSAGSYSIKTRLTGFAQEPSYLSTYLIDFILFSAIVIRHRKTKYLAIAAAISLIFLTFSPSAYISCIILSVYYLYLRHGKAYILLFFLFGVVPLLASNLTDKVEGFMYFADRIMNASQSGRLEVINTAVAEMMNANNLFTFFLGNGIKSFELLSIKYPYIRVETSNNLFVDTFFECGFVGVSLLCGFFYLSFMKLRKMKAARNKIIGSVLLMNLFVSSLYRADYASYRFGFMIFVIYVFMNYDTSGKRPNEEYTANIAQAENQA